jgi:hypothetical protein
MTSWLTMPGDIDAKGRHLDTEGGHFGLQLGRELTHQAFEFGAKFGHQALQLRLELSHHRFDLGAEGGKLAIGSGEGVAAGIAIAAIERDDRAIRASEGAIGAVAGSALHVRSRRLGFGGEPRCHHRGDSRQRAARPAQRQ